VIVVSKNGWKIVRAGAISQSLIAAALAGGTRR
jgi:hypothetical protein